MSQTPAPSLRPFSPFDLYLHLQVADLHCTPHDSTAACVIRSVDREQNSYQSKLWSFPLDGAPARQLTQGPGNDTSPRWSPDGSRLAFLSDRQGTLQVYVLNRDGGEALQISHLPNGVASLEWAPDAQHLVVVAPVQADPDGRGSRPGQPVAVRDAASPEIAWKLPYKSDGIGYLLTREMHLFAVDVQAGTHRQITDGPFDVLGHDISHDGTRIAYVRTREGRFAHATDLWLCNFDGSNHMRATDSHTNVMHPVWSPDGTHIAFTGAVLEGDAESRLWLLEVSTGATRQLADVEVAQPDTVSWTEDGSGLVFVRAHRGRHQVARVDLDGTMAVLVDRDIQIGAFGCTPTAFAMAVQHPALPSELYVHDRTNDERSAYRQLSDLNPWWKERIALDVRAKTFRVPDGRGGEEDIEGWLLQAQGAQGPRPLLSDIHGGPASYALLDFDSNVYWQVLCSQGWSVLALNAVGSASFGREFCHRLEGHWGTHDLPQHLAAIAQLQAEGVCDERVAVCGKSYGGYLTAWATGHTHIFKAAIVMAPVGNIETHYGTSDGGYYADPFYMATAPRFDRERARALSPLQYVEQSTTPTLFMQGKDDERCPKCQSEELFVSLMRAGDTPTELVLYPNEGHGFLGAGAPRCRVDAAQRIIDWLAKYCVSPPGRSG